MKHTLYLALLWATIGCTAPVEELPEYTLPPEWEPHQALWITYTGIAIDTVLDRMLVEIDPSTEVVCVVDGDSLARLITARWDSLGIARGRCRIQVAVDSLLSPVVRDAGPIFLRLRSGGLAVLDADWNSYGDHHNELGYSPAALAFEDSFPGLFAKRLGLPVVQSALVIEGGACEINGRGDLLQVEAVTMQRNPTWSRDSIERELKRVLGARRIIWLKEGVADDTWHLGPRVHGNVFNWGTGGHVDEFCRFVDDSTVLLAWPEEGELADTVHRITRARMEMNVRILRSAGLHVEHVPVPVTEFEDTRLDSARSMHRRVLAKYTDLHQNDTIRKIPAASYLNFVITNGRVFVPSYWHPGKPEAMKQKDEHMRATLQRHFPDRRIVPLDPRAINRYGGGMHCWTQQQPKSE